MRATVKKDFDYSADGLTIKRLRVGEIHEISKSLFHGLVGAGVIEPPKEFVEAQPVVARQESAPRQHFDDRRRNNRR